MQISNQPRSYQPNFGQVNLVQMPKKAFQNPERLIECSKIFNKALEKTAGTEFPLGSFMENLIALFGLGSKKVSKIYSQLESQSYVMCKPLLDKYGYSIQWLGQNTKTKLTDAIDKDMHSFYVLTREHKDKMLEKIKVNNLFHELLSYCSEGVKKYEGDKEMGALYALAKLGEKYDRQIEEVIADSNIHKFKIENLDELKNLVDRLGV